MSKNQRLTADILQNAIAKLAAKNAPSEALATLCNKTILPVFWRKQPRFIAVDRVWRLGSLLITAEGDLYASGSGVAAQPRRRLGYVSEAQEERRDLAGIAFKSGFSAGEQVNYNCRKLLTFANITQCSRFSDAICLPDCPGCAEFLALTGSVLIARDNSFFVLWHLNADPLTAPTLADYLNERIALTQTAS